MGYLNSKEKKECFGCEACGQICPKQAIEIIEDAEGFRYPKIDDSICIDCGMCREVCPVDNMPDMFSEKKTVFGGYHKERKVRGESTSGGAFTAIVESWCDENYVIFGAASEGLRVYHDYIEDKEQLYRFKKSKYSQSEMNNTYKNVKKFLEQGKKVLFSGTPCQNAALKSFLNKAKVDDQKLLMVEVICEGVPSPLFVRKYEEYMKNKFGSDIKILDYRYKEMIPSKKPFMGKWDFQVMYTELKNGKKKKLDRWFNPFWSIWLNHLMSRPACYQCKFTKQKRVADITLGDLWGVHLYCPELYGNNMGSSLIVCNSNKGVEALELAKSKLYGHDLEFETALKYQGPMRKSIDYNPDREEFMEDLKRLSYKEIVKKWAKSPSIKLLWSKYVYGNRQKIFLWNIKNKFKSYDK